MIDIHSHVVPAIDDGSPDIETSLKLCRGLMELGFSGAIATPHIISDIYPNTEISIAQSFHLLNDKLQENKVHFPLRYAAEYLLDETVHSKIQRGGKLLCVDGNEVLIEFSYAEEPENITELTFPLQLQNHSLILAHPERYRYWHGDFAKYRWLKELDLKFQVNALSLTDYYGTKVKEMANELLTKGLVDYIGTDLHHEKHLHALTKHFGKSGISQLVTKYKLKNAKTELG